MELKKFGRMRMIGIGAVALCLAVGAGIALYVADGIRYPAPEGEYQVGRTKLYLTDYSREDLLSGRSACGRPEGGICLEGSCRSDRLL